MDVAGSYNAIADWFSVNRSQTLKESKYMDRLIGLTGTGASYLDLVCGNGLPVMKYLKDQGIDVTGLDASNLMIEIAQKNLPGTAFICANMRHHPLSSDLMPSSPGIAFFI